MIYILRKAFKLNLFFHHLNGQFGEIIRKRIFTFILVDGGYIAQFIAAYVIHVFAQTLQFKLPIICFEKIIWEIIRVYFYIIWEICEIYDQQLWAGPAHLWAVIRAEENLWKDQEISDDNKMYNKSAKQVISNHPLIF